MKNQSLWSLCGRSNLQPNFFQYVEGVLKGEKAPDNAVGRKLLDLVNSVPKMSPEEFEKMVNSNMKVSSFNVQQRTFWGLHLWGDFYICQLCNIAIRTIFNFRFRTTVQLD